LSYFFDIISFADIFNISIQHNYTSLLYFCQYKYHLLPNLFRKKGRYDLEYVNNLTLGMDLKVLCMTVEKVLKRSGTLSGADQTVADFDVYRKEQKHEAD